MSKLASSWNASARGLVLVACLAAACASPTAPSTPTIPSAPAPPQNAPLPVVLTVRVLQRTVATPLPGATVVLGIRTAQSNADGVCTFSLTAGNMADVEVSAPGYQPLSASGVLNSDQRWTFYLETAD